MIAVFIIAAIAAHTVGTYVFGLDISVIAGNFAGAITNTPSLAAAAEATGDGAASTVGYAVSYLPTEITVEDWHNEAKADPTTFTKKARESMAGRTADRAQRSGR